MPKPSKPPKAKVPAPATRPEVDARKTAPPPVTPASVTRAAVFEPQLATLTRAAPSGDDWLHELKLDGYRVGARVAGGRVTLLSRRGQNLDEAAPEVRAALARLPVSSALLDGELVVLRPDGKTDFHGLQDALSGGSRANMTYYVFDLLELDGTDTRSLPQRDRKARLATVLGAMPDADAGRVRYLDHVTGHGPDVFTAACAMGAEGIVSKRAEARYLAGRTSSWLKIKAETRGDFVVGGFTSRADTGAGIGALLCGQYDDDGKLVFVGRVGTGFSDRVSAALRRRLDDSIAPAGPFDPAPPAEAARGATWVRPALVVEVAFRDWTRDRMIRHASFAGVRDDKVASEARLQAPPGLGPDATAEGTPAAPSGSRGRWRRR